MRVVHHCRALAIAALLGAGLPAALTLPAPAQAQVRRCVGADGQQVYTDRRCADIGAVERPAAPPPVTGSTLPHARRQRWMCARNVDELVYQVNDALLTGDVNRLAGVYHWPGMSTRSAYAVMARLEAIARRPTLDVQALYSNPPDPYRDGVLELPAQAGQDDWPQLPPPPRPKLLGIQVLQSAPRGEATVRTVFGLVRHYDCWWVRL